MSRAPKRPLPVRRLAALSAVACVALSVALVAAPAAHAADPDVVSYTAGIATEVHDATTGAVLAPGEIEAGDRIDYEIQVANTGNVWLDGLEICAPPGLPFTGMIWTLAQIEPGGDLTGSGLYPMEYRSAEEYSNWPPHVITDEDMARGWVQLDAIYVYASESRSRFDPLCADPQSPDAPGEWVSAAPVVLRDLATDLNLTVDMTLRDSHPDGLGQVREKVDITWTVTNPSDTEQSVTIDGATVSGNAPGPGTAFDGVTLAPGESADRSMTFAITAAMEASGSIAAEVSLDYLGDIDGLSRSTATAQAAPIATAEVPDNALDLDLDVAYADANGDGHPSIGETATVTVTVTNVGRNTLTDVEVVDGSAADVAGMPFLWPYDAPVGGVESWQFTHVITAQDFARGSILFAAEVSANEVLSTPTNASASLSPITFVAYEDDLAPDAQGGIEICSPAGESVTEASPGDSIVVVPEACGYAGSADGVAVVMFSEPTTLATDAFAASVPGDAVLGEHRIALYGADGALVGWKALAIVPQAESEPAPEPDSGEESAAEELPAKSSGELAATGADERVLAWELGGAAALLAAGVGLVLMRRPIKGE